MKVGVVLLHSVGEISLSVTRLKSAVQQSQNKYCIITGATGGIGRAICLRIAREGKYGVLVNHFGMDSDARMLVEQIKSEGGFADLIEFDVADNIAVKTQLEKWIRNSGGEIEVVINNAGVAEFQDFDKCSEQTWDHVLDVKLKGFYNVVSALLPTMKQRQSGRIVNISSWVGFYGQAGLVDYSAANGGMIAATRALAREIAPYNITVNAVAPGFIDTPMLKNSAHADLIRQIPANRLGKPEEVAELVHFLVSSKAAYINGEVIRIDGGM